jgi:hypothetical protein
VEEVNAPWAGFHTFRHTFASIHLSRGTNLLQLSRALGHHSAAFTLSRYTHLLPGDEAPALDLDVGHSESARVSGLPFGSKVRGTDGDERDPSASSSPLTDEGDTPDGARQFRPV